MCEYRHSSWYRIVNRVLAVQSLKRALHGLVDSVVEAYARAHLPVPRLTAHSTRGLTTSVAALSGLSWDVICRTASWKSDITFRQHYFRHVDLPSVGDVFLRRVVRRDVDEP